MKGYVARKGNRWYAVIDEGTDPIHREGAAQLASGRVRARRRRGSLPELRRVPHQSVAATQAARARPQHVQRLPPRRREPHRPALGRWGLRRLRPHHLEAFYDGLVHPPDGRAALAPKTVYEIQLVIRGALFDAVRRGLIHRNVALVAHAPRLRSIPRVEQAWWTAEELRAFLRAASGHRFFGAFWVAAFTGMRRGELLGLRREDFDEQAATFPSTAGYRHRLPPARDPWHDLQRPPPPGPKPDNGDGPHRRAELATGRAACRRHRDCGVDVHRRQRRTDPSARLSQIFERIARRASVPGMRLHGLRHTHGTLLISAGVPVKVVSERLGHATPGVTIDTYQHVLPRMQAEAARVFEQLVALEARPDGEESENSEKSREKRRKKSA